MLSNFNPITNFDETAPPWPFPSHKVKKLSRNFEGSNLHFFIKKLSGHDDNLVSYKIKKCNDFSSHFYAILIIVCLSAWGSCSAISNKFQPSVADKSIAYKKSSYSIGFYAQTLPRPVPTSIIVNCSKNEWFGDIPLSNLINGDITNITIICIRQLWVNATLSTKRDTFDWKR